MQHALVREIFLNKDATESHKDDEWEEETMINWRDIYAKYALQYFPIWVITSHLSEY